LQRQIKTMSPAENPDDATASSPTGSEAKKSVKIS